MKAGWDAAVDGGARVWWCPNVEDRENCKSEEQVNFMESVGSRARENHALVSPGLAYDGFGAASAEKIDETKEMIKCVIVTRSWHDRFANNSQEARVRSHYIALSWN